jgi:hypothetical protein
MITVHMTESLLSIGNILISLQLGEGKDKQKETVCTIQLLGTIHQNVIASKNKILVI